MLFAPLATNTPKHTRSLCFEQLVLCATDCALYHSPSVHRNWTQNVWKVIGSSLWPDCAKCFATYQIIMMTRSHCVDFSWPLLQRQLSPCCCTGSCCSGRTGPWGISSTTPVRASGNARRTWVVKSSTTLTRARQVNVLWLYLPLLFSLVSNHRFKGILKAYHFWHLQWPWELIALQLKKTHANTYSAHAVNLENILINLTTHWQGKCFQGTLKSDGPGREAEPVLNDLA